MKNCSFITFFMKLISVDKHLGYLDIELIFYFKHAFKIFIQNLKLIKILYAIEHEYLVILFYLKL